MSDDSAALFLQSIQRKLRRESLAREEAESLLEEKSKELYLVNQGLEEKVEDRTRMLNEAKIAAELATQTKSLFLAKMSHEIRTPLNGIKGLLFQMPLDNLSREQRESIRLLKQSTELLNNIVTDILDFSKMEAGQFKLQKTSIDLIEFIEETSFILLPSVYEKKIDFHLFIDPKLPQSCFSDANKMRQVLLNILNNSIKFTEKGQIEFKVLKKQEHIQFIIRDTGLGIGKDELKEIFNPFSQAKAKSTTLEGTGLGLTIVREIVDLFDGSIQVKSEREKGTEFSIEIPLEQPVYSKCLSFENRAVYVDLNQNLTRDYVVALLNNRKIKLVNKALVSDLVITDKKENFGSVNVLFLKNGIQNKSDDEHRATWSVPFSRSNFDLLFDDSKKNQVIEKDFSQKVSKQNIKIGIAEDNKINQIVIQRLLEKNGYEVYLASNGEEMLSKITRDTDLIIMDCQMPVMDGFECAKRIRSHVDLILRNIPIIALTAGATSENEEKCYMAGMNGFLTKPLDMEQVLEKMDELILKKESA